MTAGSVDNVTLRQATGLSGFALYAIVPPVIHAIHNRGAIAGIDVALRLGLPLVAAGIGWQIGIASRDSRPDDVVYESVKPLVYALWGLLVGAGTAIATDSLLLAREEVVVHAPLAPAVAWAPVLSPREGGATAGVAGRF